MITKSEAYHIAQQSFPELSNKLYVRIIDSIPDPKCDFTYLDYPIVEEFWLVQFSSITNDYSSYGSNDFRTCFNGIWISKKTGKILKQSYYTNVDGLDIEKNNVELNTEEEKIRFELLIREKALDQLGFIYKEGKGWERKIPLENLPLLDLDVDDLPTRKGPCVVPFEIDFDIDYTLGTTVYPIKTYLKRWDRLKK